jgi:hypothetical protein
MSTVRHVIYPPVKGLICNDFPLWKCETGGELRQLSSFVVVVIRRHCHVVSSLFACLHGCCVTVVRCCRQRQRWQRIRGGRYDGRWALWLLDRRKRVVEHTVYSPATHSVIAVWTTWHIPRGLLRHHIVCYMRRRPSSCCRCGWCVCVCQGE